MQLAPAKYHALIGNHLLASLPGEVSDELCSYFELVHLSYCDTLYHCADVIQDVYFPVSCVISAVAIMNDGATVEVGMIGREGITGVVSIFDNYPARNWTRVLIPGAALKMPSSTLRDLFYRNDILQFRLLRYYRAMINQISQRTVCNGRHTVMQRLCTWLLMVHDRVESDDIPLTQEVIASKLGLRRASVTTAAGMLQRTNIIECRRGHVYVMNRKALEATACECYRVFKEQMTWFQNLEGVEQNPLTLGWQSSKIFEMVK